jgi:uncharacterized damage-inducible protein DinB
MAAVIVGELLRSLDAAFEGDTTYAGDDWHSLLGNLGTVPPEAWAWLPPGGARSILAIVRHIGRCKLEYDDCAFGAATLGEDDPLMRAATTLGDPAAALDWLRACNARLRRSIAALDDAELSRPRRTIWGDERETRWLIGIMIQHDLYHAGEINHLRSLHSGDDDWEGE